MWTEKCNLTGNHSSIFFGWFSRQFRLLPTHAISRSEQAKVWVENVRETNHKQTFLLSGCENRFSRPQKQSGTLLKHTRDFHYWSRRLFKPKRHHVLLWKTIFCTDNDKIQVKGSKKPTKIQVSCFPVVKFVFLHLKKQSGALLHTTVRPTGSSRLGNGHFGSHLP